MRKIVVGFSRSKKKIPIFSWLVRLWQGGTAYSHVYLKVFTTGILLNSDTYLHAAEGKVFAMSSKQFLKRNEPTDEYQIIVNTNTFKKLINEMHELSGEDYGYMQNIGIIIVQLFRLFGKEIKNPFPSGFNCSELVQELLELEFDFSQFDKNTITPRDVKERIDALDKQDLFKIHKVL